MKLCANTRGLTILEMLVGMTVAAAFAVAATSFYRGEVRALGTHSATLDATDKVRAVMGFTVREIRDAGYDPRVSALTTAGFKGLRFAGPSAVWIVADTGQDGSIDYNATDPNAESVVYTYDAANHRIVRTVAGVDQQLVGNVPAGGFTLQYFDASGNALPFDTAPAVTIPSGAPSFSASVSQALNGQGQVLSPANRDLVALVRIGFQVQTVGMTPAINFALATRFVLPARNLDKL
jgi:type II secretory pathway component PulJ